MILYDDKHEHPSRGGPRRVIHHSSTTTQACLTRVFQSPFLKKCTLQSVWKNSNNDFLYTSISMHIPCGMTTNTFRIMTDNKYGKTRVGEGETQRKSHIKDGIMGSSINLGKDEKVLFSQINCLPISLSACTLSESLYKYIKIYIVQIYKDLYLQTHV